jgi:hypothetical protein
MNNGERSLADLKKDYSILEKKYSLPIFSELNEEFFIESLAEMETELLIKHIRRLVLEKIAYFTKFIETMINPSEGGSLLVFSITKNMNQENRKVLAEIYEKFSRLEVESLKRELDYSEEEEAEFIKKIYFFWKDIKKDLLGVVQSIDFNWDNKIAKSEKSYFR